MLVNRQVTNWREFRFLILAVLCELNQKRKAKPNRQTAATYSLTNEIKTNLWDVKFAVMSEWERNVQMPRPNSRVASSGNLVLGILGERSDSVTFSRSHTLGGRSYW